MAELPQLSRTEWEAMMANVLADVSVDPTEKWGTVESPGNKGNDEGGAKTATEIPDNHPAKGGPRTPEGEKDDEIPAGGGFTTVPSHTPETGPVSKETPADGPASSDSPADKPDKVDDNKWAAKVGKPEPTGKPSGSFARLQDVKYDGTSWTTKGPVAVPSKTVTQWSGSPAGAADGTGPDGTPTKTVSKDDPTKFPGKSRTDSTPAPTNADEDLDNDKPDNLSLPDGTFLTQNVDDLKNNIDKVKNADQTNPRHSTHPWYLDVKRHLMNRAADLGATHLIPADWNLSMGYRAEREIARDIDAALREEYAKKGWALPNKSYPIGNVHDLRNAIDLARSGHGDVQAAKALIRRRAKDLGVELPADFK